MMLKAMLLLRLVSMVTLVAVEGPQVFGLEGALSGVEEAIAVLLAALGLVAPAPRKQDDQRDQGL